MNEIRQRVVKTILPELDDIELDEVFKILGMLPERSQFWLIENLFASVEMRRAQVFMRGDKIG